MVPPNDKTKDLYQNSAILLERALRTGDLELPLLNDAISVIKGMVNRCLRRDQPDWFVVWYEMGLPTTHRLHIQSKDLPSLRKAILSNDTEQAVAAAERLRYSGLLSALCNFLGKEEPFIEPGSGFLYALGSREQAGLLKIGQTTREIFVRVDEINRATGMVYPLGVWDLWRVRDPVGTERAVHTLLAGDRVRSDREFFSVNLHDASRLIGRFLLERDDLVRREGTISRLFEARGYGFITAEDADYFFHASQVVAPSFSELRVGCVVGFDYIDSGHGHAAARVCRMSEQ
jgi:cold shock CspA family protein